MKVVARICRGPLQQLGESRWCSSANSVSSHLLNNQRKIMRFTFTLVYSFATFAGCSIRLGSASFFGDAAHWQDVDEPENWDMGQCTGT